MPLFSFLSENQRQKLGFYKMSLVGPEGKEREWAPREPASSGLFLGPCKTKARLMPGQLRPLSHKSSRSRHPPPRVPPPQYFSPHPTGPERGLSALPSLLTPPDKRPSLRRISESERTRSLIYRKKTASELRISKEPASVSAQMA